MKARGVALAPGVSRNGRLYTPQVVRQAYERLHARLGDPAGRPVVMRTHHGAGDDSTRIVARVSKVALDGQGRLTFEADMADTTAGRDIAALASGDRPALANVSIYGWWLGDTRTETHESGQVETADDLEIDAIDFTYAPGVGEARASVEHTPPAGRALVTESATAEIVDEAARPAGEVRYADPGYQADKQKRYPIDTAAHVRAAWSYINQGRNAGQYTAAQVRRIKARIKAAAKQLGVRIDGESWAVTEPAAESTGEVGQSDGGLNVSASNGPITISISGYGLDPADLALILRRVCDAASAALATIDPDLDGDIDLPGGTPGETRPDDDEMESSTTEKEPAVAESESTPAAETAAAPIVLAPESVTALAEALAVAIRPAPAAENTDQSSTDESTAGQENTATETTALVDVKALVEQARQAAVEQVRAELREAGVFPTRKGYRVTPAAESSDEDLWANRGEHFARALGALGAPQQ